MSKGVAKGLLAITIVEQPLKGAATFKNITNSYTINLKKQASRKISGRLLFYCMPMPVMPMPSLPIGICQKSRARGEGFLAMASHIVQSPATGAFQK